MEAQAKEALTHNGQPINGAGVLQGGEFETVREWLDCAKKVLRTRDDYFVSDGENPFFFCALNNYCFDKAPMNSALQSALWQRYVRLSTMFSDGISYDQADREALKTANLINNHLIYSRLDED